MDSLRFSFCNRIFPEYFCRSIQIHQFGNRRYHQTNERRHQNDDRKDRCSSHHEHQNGTNQERRTTADKPFPEVLPFPRGGLLPSAGRGKRRSCHGSEGCRNCPDSRRSHRFHVPFSGRRLPHHNLRQYFCQDRSYIRRIETVLSRYTPRRIFRNRSQPS